MCHWLYRCAGIVDSILEEVVQLSGQKHSYKSVGQFSKEKFKEKVQMLDLKDDEKNMLDSMYRWIRLLEMIENACASLDYLDINGYNQYVLCGGEPNTELLHSYSSILKLLQSAIPADRLKLNKPVTKVKVEHGDYVNWPVRVQCSDGSLYEAKHVVITISLGCLKELAEGMFDPPLPRYKMRAIKRMGFGTVNKIYLEFPEVFWEQGVDGVQLFPDETTEADLMSENLEGLWQKAIVGFATLPDHPRVLQTFLAGRAAKYMETLHDDVVIDCVTSRLQQYLKRTDIPKPTTIIRTTWHSNPYARGSYSNIPVNASSQDPNNLSQPVPSHENPRLLFAGEATSPRYYSTTHGALLSGQREAKRILNFRYKKQNDVKY